MAREGRLVEHLLMAQRNPKHLDAFGGISDIRGNRSGEHYEDDAARARRFRFKFVQSCGGRRVDDDVDDEGDQQLW